MYRKVHRRTLLCGSLGLGVASKLSADTTPLVALKYGSDPYATTLAAIEASGQFPAVSGKAVVIKPNLVAAAQPSTGTTTDPEVVRAIVDTCLAAGASSVSIAEASGWAEQPPPFSVCGYDLFQAYDPRVSLVDLDAQSVSLVQNPSAMLYRRIWLPELATQPDTIWISVGKLKVHSLSTVTLSVKNMFGLYLPRVYKYAQGAFLPRTDPHERGMDQSIIDMLVARPVHFAVVDGIVGMEVKGPLNGAAIAANTIVAGSNPVAVDRVAAQVMGAPQERIVHLFFAALMGLGPQNFNSITLTGDPLVQVPFRQASVILPPTSWPTAYPSSIASGSRSMIGYQITTNQLARLEVVTANDETPSVDVKRILFDWKVVVPGRHSLAWDGRADDGSLLPPGSYSLRLLTRYLSAPAARINANSASSHFSIT